MKQIKWIFLILIACLAFLLVPTSPLLPMTYVQSNEYEHWMRDNISSDRLILDIAMPGAHDAFTSSFSYQSIADPGMAKQGDTVAKLASNSLSFLYRSLLIRYSKTQQSNFETLLLHGVRYFDVRLTYTPDGYYTTHGFLGEPFEPLLTTLSTFLASHPGEIVLLHFQHVFDERNENAVPNATTWQEINSLLSATQITNYVYPSENTTLSSLTYGAVTSLGTESKVFLIGDNRDTIDHPNWFSGPNTLRSTWHNTIDTASLLDGIRTETQTIDATPSEYSKFRVLQGQKTAQLNQKDVLATLFHWSLLDAAKTSNSAVLEIDIWDQVIHATPILMFDAIDHNEFGFYDMLMERIIAYHQ